MNEMKCTIVLAGNQFEFDTAKTEWIQNNKGYFISKNNKNLLVLRDKDKNNIIEFIFVSDVTHLKGRTFDDLIILKNASFNKEYLKESFWRDMYYVTYHNQDIIQKINEFLENEAVRSDNFRFRKG